MKSSKNNIFEDIMFEAIKSTTVSGDSEFIRRLYKYDVFFESMDDESKKSALEYIKSFADNRAKDTEAHKQEVALWETISSMAKDGLENL